MHDHFLHKPEWTETQSKIFQSTPNLIVSGCAGSGKTLLACHLAIKHAKDNKVAILVYTKSLRTFVRQYIDSFGDNNISVLYEFQWRSRNFPDFDLIIVDEFQDFSINDISNVISAARKGVYLFGDIQQKLYRKNFQKEPTLNFDELLAKTTFKHINLEDNFRISEENKNFIASLYKKNSLNNSSFATTLKPKILHFESVLDEMNWLKDFLQNNITFKNIGILLKSNESFIGGYPYRRNFRKEKVFGILELNNFFNENNIPTTFKYKGTDRLDFTKEVNINIMTYHSAKGLQFDCVVLPFSNYINQNRGSDNLPYVGLTRASKQIIITYSGLVADEYSVRIEAGSFEGKVSRKNINDDLPNNNFSKVLLLTELKKTPGFENLNIGNIQFDLDGCDVIRS